MVERILDVAGMRTNHTVSLSNSTPTIVAGQEFTLY